MQNVIHVEQEALPLVRSSIEMKRRVLEYSLRRYQNELTAFEAAHKMSSETFAAKFRQGELGDDVAWFEWEFALDAYRATKHQLELLEIDGAKYPTGSMNISDELIQRAKDYLAMVDEPDGYTGTPERDAERTEAHERLMDEMERCNIPFPSRFEARWIARWIVAQHRPNFDSSPSLLWAKPNGDNDWFKEIRHVPPADNREGWIPIVVKFEPLSSLGTIYERNQK